MPNDFVKNDVENASTGIINDLSHSAIITDMLEKEIIDYKFMNSSKSSNSFNTSSIFYLVRLYIKRLNLVLVITFLLIIQFITVIVRH